MAVLGCGYLSKHVLDLYSFELMLASSCPEVFCKKVILKSFAKFTEKHLR